MLTFRDTNHLRRYLRTLVAIDQLTEVDDVIQLVFRATLIGTRGAVVEILERDMGNHMEETMDDCDECHVYMAQLNDGQCVAVRLKFRARVSTLEYDTMEPVAA